MINLDNIHSLTDFKRNASNYVEQVRETHSPLVLTVNGKAAVVVQDAIAFQALLNQNQAMATELQELKLASLRQSIQIGIDQIDRGQYTEYTDDAGIDALFEDIRNPG
jgi:prevent-host-death family protein